MKLPDFFIIGAQKAGTTTLHEILSKETQICLPEIKETHFFSRTDRYQKGEEWYYSQFVDCSNGQIIGEVDPDYSFFPNAPIRIKKKLSNPRFIFILRHPLKRAYSHYLMSLRRSIEKYDFATAIQVEEKRLGSSTDEYALEHFSYLSRGAYSKQISRYKEVFPDSKFLFIEFEKMVDPLLRFSVYKKICDFIEIKSILKEKDLEVKSNVASESRLLFITRMLYGESLIKSYLGKFIHSEDTKLRIAMLIDKINKKKITKRRVTSIPKIDERYIIQIRKEIDATKRITGLDLKDWAEQLPTY